MKGLDVTVPLNFSDWHGVISVGVGLLHGFCSVYFNDACGKTDGYELSIARVGDVIGKEFGVKFDFEDGFFGENVDDSEHVVIGVGNDVSFGGINTEVNDFLVFLGYENNLHA